DLLRGRTFVDGDDLDGPHVAIISRRMAERHWPGENPVGRRLLGWRDRPMRIVGVVDDVRERDLETEATNLVYLPLYKNPWWPDMFLVLRARGDPAALAPDLRSAVARVDPSLPVSFVRPLTEVVADTLGARRLNAALLGAFAGVALLLACAGIYGVISYGVARRQGEIGVRMALGARASQVVGLVVRQGMTAVLAGVALGLVGAFAVTRLLASQLYGIAAGDPLSFATAVLFLTLTALLACVVPATRAARIDPMESLRDT
ncbi:MAG: FtsX-like permease family protein, partial [Acidobacteriota bacterium]